MVINSSGRVRFPQMTISRAIIINANGQLESSSITSTGLAYLLDGDSNIQTQLDGKQATLSNHTYAGNIIN